MKRCIVPLLSLLLSLLLISASGDSAVVVGSDVPEGWYFLPTGSSVSLPDGFSLLPASASFIVPIGEYVVGVDFPAGAYSARCADGVDVTTLTFYNTKGAWFLLETLNAENGDLIGKVDLEEGFTVSVRNGAAYFSAPSGIVFD